MPKAAGPTTCPPNCASLGIVTMLGGALRMLLAAGCAVEPIVVGGSVVQRDGGRPRTVGRLLKNLAIVANC